MDAWQMRACVYDMWVHDKRRGRSGGYCCNMAVGLNTHAVRIGFILALCLPLWGSDWE